MREITTHKVNSVNDGLVIEVLDEPGPGGAHHTYHISKADPLSRSSTEGLTINFQNGPIKEAGVNGVTHEALLAIIQDRLECFQKGPYACRENALALTHLQEAIHWLNHRTRERAAHGVEGTMAK